MSRSLLRSVLELRTPLTRLPPAFLTPIQARRTLTTATARRSQDIQQTAETTTTELPTPLDAIPKPTVSPSPTEETAPTAAAELLAASPTTLYPKQPQTTTPLSTTSAESLSHLLPLLRAQPAHYITAHIWGRPYLVTPGDRIRLPFRMPGVVPGDVLRLDRASTLGSRDYTLKGAPYIDERLFSCRATVLGVESEPLRVKVKTKRRQRRAKTVKSKHRYTMLAISELSVNGPEVLGL